MNSTSPTPGLDRILTPKESSLLLMDHQPFQFADLHSHEPTMVANNVVGLAKAAMAFGIPTILTTILQDCGGLIIKGLQEVFPDQEPIDRTSINSWQDSRVVEAVERTGRKKLILAGLWTEICLAMPAIQAAAGGYHVFAVVDASGGATREAHDMAILRMVAAGVTPITWLAVVGELQRDWARTDTATRLGPMFDAHAGGTGIAFSWEQQLLSASALPPSPQQPVAVTG